VSSEQQTGSLRGGRIQFIDLLRGWAVIVMIETHVFNASLDPVITNGYPFQLLKFVNGLVAPSFLFASGLAYAVTTNRKINEYLAFGPKLFRQLGRLSLIIGIGYLMHLPRFSLQHLLTLTEARQWEAVYQADVLQCIGVSLLVIQLVLLAVRSERALYRVVFAITIGLLAATPFMWSIDAWTIVPPPVGEYLNGLHHSLFPLFPWSSFLFAGSLTGYWYVRSGRTKSDAGVVLALGAIAVLLIISSLLLTPLTREFYPVYDYWRFSPAFVLLRLGLVCVLTAGMFLYERRAGVSPSSVVTLIGRQSLLVYVAHLFLIYGDFGVFSFQDAAGNAFSYHEALAATIILFLLMYLLAATWERVRSRGVQFTRRVQLAGLLILLGLFLFTPA